ncbi:MAG: hypothetical protein P8N76_10720 [Pirellulaceae bacterium]|nr:hypothetical protein [Pirellulaceae bacterium]
MLVRSTSILFFCSLITFPSFVTADNILDSKSTKWRYQDNVSGVADRWTGPDFDDSTWATGTAPLGYGDADTDAKQSGKLTFGTDPKKKRTVAFLRHSLNVANPNTIKKVHGKFLCDDGCVVYLNGTEVHRFNLRKGELTKQTQAGFAMGGDLERYQMSFVVDPKLLKAGKNVVAVRLHQASPDSSDLAFDLMLKPLTDDDEVQDAEATVAEEKAAIESMLDGNGA